MAAKHISILALCLPLAACNLGMGDPTNSSFTTPSSSGQITRASGGRTGAITSPETGNIFAYQVGSVTDDGLQGFAGLAPGASVSAAPVAGSGSFVGLFEVGVIAFVIQNGTQVTGQTTVDRGAIGLTVDFGSGTVTGGGTGLDAGLTNVYLDQNPLTIDGTFSGGTLTGTAIYNGISGPLRGLVGANEVIGAFHGHTDSHVHAGGFVANP